MSIINKMKILVGALYNDNDRFIVLNKLGMYDNIPDEQYIKKMFKIKFGKELNLHNPQTFNEKLQWLKLNNRNPEYTKMVDKYNVKKYVGEIIGEDYIIPTLGVWNNFNQIDFSKLPSKFVIKCTHDSGGVVICEDKNKLDFKIAKKIIDKCLKRNYYLSSREWPYKGVKPQIIVEKYLEMKDENCAEFKLFCYNGKFNWVMVSKGIGHSNSRTNDAFDKNFKHIPVQLTWPNSSKEILKPAEFDKLIRLSEKLSNDIPQVRVDWYLLNGKIYFGELTFYHAGGFCDFKPPIYDKILGKELVLKDL